jgi:multicomponent Na+:H+ antiporter subunit C
VSTQVVFVLAASAVFGVGVYGLIVADHLMRKLLALNVMGSAVFVFILTVAGATPDGPDPVGQALVLTGIVIAIAATAFALALMVRMYQETGQTSLRGRERDDD